MVRESIEEYETTEESLEDSQDSSRNGELEKSVGLKEFNQAVAQTIVFAFTEYNRHPDKNSVIPSVLIDKTHFYILLYSPVSDFLVTACLRYNYGPDFGENSIFMRVIITLWVILNYKLFFHKCPELLRLKTTGFSNKIDNLCKYKELKQFSNHISEPIDDTSQFPLGCSFASLTNTRESKFYFDEIESFIVHRPDEK